MNDRDWMRFPSFIVKGWIEWDIRYRRRGCPLIKDRMEGSLQKTGNKLSGVSRTVKAHFDQLSMLVFSYQHQDHPQQLLY